MCIRQIECCPGVMVDYPTPGNDTECPVCRSRFTLTTNDSAPPFEPLVCLYSAVHKANGVPATTTIDCGVVGVVPACDACAEFYARQG